MWPVWGKWEGSESGIQLIDGRGVQEGRQWDGCLACVWEEMSLRTHHKRHLLWLTDIWPLLKSRQQGDASLHFLPVSCSSLISFLILPWLHHWTQCLPARCLSIICEICVFEVALTYSRNGDSIGGPWVFRLCPLSCPVLWNTDRITMRSHPVLHSELQINQGYRVRPCLKTRRGEQLFLLLLVVVPNIKFPGLRAASSRKRSWKYFVGSLHRRRRKGAFSLQAMELTSIFLSNVSVPAGRHWNSTPQAVWMEYSGNYLYGVNNFRGLRVWSVPIAGLFMANTGIEYSGSSNISSLEAPGISGHSKNGV